MTTQEYFILDINFVDMFYVSTYDSLKHVFDESCNHEFAHLQLC